MPARETAQQIYDQCDKLEPLRVALDSHADPVSALTDSILAAEEHLLLEARNYFQHYVDMDRAPYAVFVMPGDDVKNLNFTIGIGQSAINDLLGIALGVIVTGEVVRNLIKNG